MHFCFVFGLEPWLLPPALDMIAVLKDNGHKVKVIYAEYQGKKPDSKDYDVAYTHNVIPKHHGFQRLLTFRELTKSVEEYINEYKPDLIIACDILSLQSISGISGIIKGYWGFEIINKPAKVKMSLDFYRAIRFPDWVSSMNFFLSPSKSRVEKVTRRLATPVPHAIIYNCRKLVKNNIPVETNFTSKKNYKLIYTGMISKSQYIEETIDAMELLDVNVKLTLAGPSNPVYFNMLKDKIAKNPVLANRVTLMGRLSREEVYALTDSADIGFVFYNENDGTGASDPAPNKLSDYIASHLWIVGGKQDYIKYWLEEKGAGVSITDITKEKIAASIKTILTEQKFNDKTVLTHIYNNELNMNVQAEILLGLISTVNR